MDNCKKTLEQGLKEIELQRKVCLEHNNSSFAVSELHRIARDYIQHALELLMPIKKPEYQIWVTLEKWQDDNKMEDVETYLVGTVKAEEEGRQLFMAAQDMSIAVKSHLESMLKTLEP